MPDLFIDTETSGMVDWTKPYNHACQPWIVQGLMTIDQAVSPNVTPAMLAISLVGFTLIYGLLMVADVYLLQKFARDKDNEGPAPQTAPKTDQPKTALKGAY